MWDIISYFLRVRSAVKKTNQSYLNIIIEFATIINFVTFSNVDFFIISNIGYFYSYVMYINVYLFNVYGKGTWSNGYVYSISHVHL